MNMESSEDQELVVVVQLAEPSEPLYERNEEDDEITETKLTEEDNSQDMTDATVENQTTANQPESQEVKTIIKDVVDVDMNLQSNNGTENTTNDTETNDEVNIKSVEEDSEAKPNDDTPLDTNRKRKIELFTDHVGPEWYNVRGSLVTKPILATNIPKLFESMPIFGRPQSHEDLDTFNNNKLREFIGQDIDDDAFEELSKYCSPDHLKTGDELMIKSSMLSQGMLSATEIPEIDTEANLSILKKCKMRQDRDIRNSYTIKLKYRGVRLIPWGQDDDKDVPTSESDDTMLEPGKDILYCIRLYRPYTYHVPKDRCTRGRHSVFSCEVWCAGRGALAELRARIVCDNDLDIRLDVSDAPQRAPQATAREVFPSGFLFINNTFYVDMRPGCKDHSRIIREWASSRGMGDFPVKDMATVTLDDIVVRLGYPEVYVHQGNCEHVFTFSEIRLLSSSDPLRLDSYPRHTSVSQHQTIYCTTCAEFGAKWIVVGCDKVPFDPAFFCDTCFKQYLYIDGVKICDFRAYSYKGNETNTLKPC